MEHPATVDYNRVFLTAVFETRCMYDESSNKRVYWTPVFGRHIDMAIDRPYQPNLWSFNKINPSHQIDYVNIVTALDQIEDKTVVVHPTIERLLKNFSIQGDIEESPLIYKFNLVYFFIQSVPSFDWNGPDKVNNICPYIPDMVIDELMEHIDGNQLITTREMGYLHAMYAKCIHLEHAVIQSLLSIESDHELPSPYVSYPVYFRTKLLPIVLKYRKMLSAVFGMPDTPLSKYIIDHEPLDIASARMNMYTKCRLTRGLQCYICPRFIHEHSYNKIDTQFYAHGVHDESFRAWHARISLINLAFDDPCLIDMFQHIPGNIGYIRARHNFDKHAILTPVELFKIDVYT